MFAVAQTEPTFQGGDDSSMSTGFLLVALLSSPFFFRKSSPSVTEMLDAAGLTVPAQGKL